MEEGHEKCPQCQGRGDILIPGCPKEYVSDDVWHMMPLVDWASARDGRILPIGGGVLNQTASFMECLALVRAEESRIEAAAARMK